MSGLPHWFRDILHGRTRVEAAAGDLSLREFSSDFDCRAAAFIDAPPSDVTHVDLACWYHWFYSHSCIQSRTKP